MNNYEAPTGNGPVAYQKSEPLIIPTLSDLQDRVKTLAETLGSLETRIGPILRPATPKDINKKSSPDGAAPLQFQLRLLADEVESMQRWAGSILSRLDL